MKINLFNAHNKAAGTVNALTAAAFLATTSFAAFPAEATPPKTAQAASISSEAYAPIGEPAGDADADVRGGAYVAVIVGGVVVATRWCASNTACKTIATTIIKGIAKAGGKYIYEKSEPALHSKLCNLGHRKYC